MWSEVAIATALILEASDLITVFDGCLTSPRWVLQLGVAALVAGGALFSSGFARPRTRRHSRDMWIACALIPIAVVEAVVIFFVQFGNCLG